MKICVFSDSHGYAGNMVAAIELEKPDLLFFLGDGERDIAEIYDKYPALPIYAVKGNCDFSSALNNSICCSVGGVAIYMTHGHLYRVKYEDDLRTLTYHAKEAGARVALYGHTHYQELSENDGVTLMNPGSIGRGYYPSYGVLIIENGECRAELKAI